MKCIMQNGLDMSEAWCDYAQQRDLCQGCTRNRGRDESKYQQEKRREREDRVGGERAPQAGDPVR